MIPAQHIERVFDCVPQACAEARLFVTGTLTELIDANRLHDAKIATAEYVTNAIKYSPGKIRVGVDIADRHVIVHIVDSGSGATIPQARQVGSDEEGGRGLPLVEALTDATGRVPAAQCCCSPGAGGWCCWFRIDRPAAATTFPCPPVRGEVTS